MDSRGQSMSLDMMAGLFIFLLLLTLFIILWDLNMEGFRNYTGRTDTQIAAISLSDQLVSSPGKPGNWTLFPLEAESIGLAGRQGEIDPFKASSLSGMPYAYQKQVLGMDRDFFGRVEGATGVLHFLFGSEPDNQSARWVETTRIATMNGTIVFLRVRVYE